MRHNVALIDDIFDLSPIMIWNIGQDGKVIDVNQAVCEDMGMTADDIIGKSMFHLFPLDAHKFCSDYEKIMQSGIPILKSNELCHRNNGVERWSICNKLPLRDGTGNVIGVTILAVDITEQKIAEATIKRNEQTLKRANDIFKIEGRISREMMDGDVDLDYTLMDIGKTLELNSIFVYKCNGVIKLTASWVKADKWCFPMLVDGQEDTESVNRWIQSAKPLWCKADKLPKEVIAVIGDEARSGIGTAAIVPVSVSGEPWGMVGFGTANGRYWTDEEMEALYGLGSLLAMLANSVIENQELMTKIDSTFSELNLFLGKIESPANKPEKEKSVAYANQ